MAKWKGEEIIAIARPHVNERYILGARAPLTNGNYKGPWDCAEFATWCAYQAYNVVFGAVNKDARKADPYSGQWYVDGKEQDALISAQDALRIPGAILGRRPKTMGLNIGHVAISLGDGRTIEARGTKHGVVIVDSAQRSWNFGVLIPGVEYSRGGTLPYTPATNDRNLRVDNPFMRGSHIRSVQEALRARGIDPGTIDGIYGEDTETAVHNFQAMEGLTVDGEVGEETARELGLGWPIDPNDSGIRSSGPTYPQGSAASGATYTVAGGDTLNGIAQRLGCDIDAIMDANPQLATPNDIKSGQVLSIPCATPLSTSIGRTPVPVYTDDELEVLAKTIFGEARGESQVGQEAIGFVVLNRIKAKSWWGRDIIGVCKHPWQFSCWNKKDPNSAKLNSMNANHPELRSAMEAARRVLTRQAQNPIDDATHYYADSIQEPSWVAAGTFVKKIGRHRFFADVS